MSDTPSCEQVKRWKPDVEFCGKVAVRRYPAMGGGFMHLCIEHGKPHEKYAEVCYEAEHD